MTDKQQETLAWVLTVGALIYFASRIIPRLIVGAL